VFWHPLMSQTLFLRFVEILTRDNVLVMHHELVEELMSGTGLVRTDPSHEVMEAVLEHSKGQAGVMGVADECLHFMTHLSVDVGNHIRVHHKAIKRYLLFRGEGNNRAIITSLMAAVSASLFSGSLLGLHGGFIALHDCSIIRDMIHVAIGGFDMGANNSSNVDGNNLRIGCAGRLLVSKVEV
jgi:hypothetical protein